MSIPAVTSSATQPPKATTVVSPSSTNKPAADTKQSIVSNAHNAASDTVSISSAAKAALLEATETAAQTAKEARSGDRQAIKVLAKQAAASKLR